MISLIVIDYNSIERTMDYIKHCFSMISESQQINTIIVDNSCNSKAFDFIEKLEVEKIHMNYDSLKEEKIYNIYSYKFNKHNLVLVQAKDNIGYAKGNNLGARVSNALFNDNYYIFSNNDLVFKKKICLNNLIKLFNNSDIAVVGPKIVGLDGKPQSPRKRNNIWKQLILYFPNMILHNMFGKFISNIDYTNASKYSYWVMGCFIVVDKAKFNEVYMFDENTFLFAEEMILAERLLKKGYKNYFYNEIEIIHNHGQTVKDNYNILMGQEISFNSNYYYFKNYIKSNKINLFLARLSFGTYKILFPLKCLVAKRIKILFRRVK